jgi:hypothetical protein
MQIRNLRFANIVVHDIGNMAHRMVNPNMWAFNQLLAIVIIVYWIDRRGSDMFIYLFAVFHVWMLWLTQSRGSIIALIATLSASLFLVKSRGKVFSTILVCILTVSLITLLQMVVYQSPPEQMVDILPPLEQMTDIPPPLEHPIISTPQNRVLSVDLFDTKGRYDIWRHTIERFFSSSFFVILFGAGNGASISFTTEAVAASSMWPDINALGPHSMYLAFLIDFGILGFILTCVFIAHVIKVLWCNSKSTLIFIIPLAIVGAVTYINKMAPFTLSIAILLTDYAAGSVRKKRNNCN